MNDNVTPARDNHPVRTMKAHETYELLRDIQTLWPDLQITTVLMNPENRELKRSIKIRLDRLIR